MHAFLTPLLQLQRFFIPILLIALAWAVWKTIFRKDLAIGLALYACLIVVVDGFYNTGIYIPGLAKGSIRYSEICALFLLFGCKRPSGPRSHQPAVLLFAGGYFALMLVATLRSDPLSQGLLEFRRIMVPQILTLVLAYRGLDTIAEYRRFLLCLTALVLLVGVFCFWDVFFDINILHSDMLNKPEYYHNRRIGRFGSIFLNPNLLGAFVVLVFAPLLSLLLSRQSGRVKAYISAGLLALLFCLVQTQSRAPLAVFAATVAIFVMGPVSGLSRARRLMLVLAAIAVFAVFMPGFIKHSTQRFDALNTEESVVEVSRASMWQYTARLIGQHPLFGIGFGEQQFIAAMRTTDFLDQYGRQSLDNPHNSYLQAAIYAGIPALILFLVANIVLLFKAWRAAQQAMHQKERATEIFGLTISITGFLACIYPDMHLFTFNIAPLYWLFFGLLLSLLPTSESAPIGQTKRRGPITRHAKKSRIGAAPIDADAQIVKLQETISNGKRRSIVRGGPRIRRRP